MNIDEVLENVTSVGISGHVRPDGDCVGSCLGVYNYIKTYYPEVDLHVYLDPIPNIFKFMANSDAIETIDEDSNVIPEHDLFISMDCGDLGRLGPSKKYFKKAKHTFCVDHHLSKEAFAEKSYVVPDASSTCELIFQIMDSEKITKEVAECLYTGIIHDTGVFMHDCTVKSTMEAAGVLMEKGIDFSRIIRETFFMKTYDQNRMMAHCLLKSTLYDNGRVIASCVSKEEMQEFHVQTKHLDGIVNQLLNTKDVLVALFLYELENGEYKASLRSNADINLVDIVGRFGGGGHAKAAGCSLAGDPKETEKRLVDLAIESLKGIS